MPVHVILLYAGLVAALFLEGDIMLYLFRKLYARRKKVVSRGSNV